MFWVSSFSTLMKEFLQFATNLDSVFQPIPARLICQARGTGFFLFWVKKANSSHFPRPRRESFSAARSHKLIQSLNTWWTPSLLDFFLVTILVLNDKFQIRLDPPPPRIIQKFLNSIDTPTVGSQSIYRVFHRKWDNLLAYLSACKSPQ